jgi:hypothetical protein
MASDDAVQAAAKAIEDRIRMFPSGYPHLGGVSLWGASCAELAVVAIAAVRPLIAAEAHALVLRFAGVYHADSPGAMADDIAARIERGEDL